jgi:hypothetical protein
MTYYQDPFFLDQFRDEAYFPGFATDDYGQQQDSATAKCSNPWALSSSHAPSHTLPGLYTLKTCSSDGSYVSPCLDALEAPYGDTIGPLELQRRQSAGSQLPPLDLDLDLDLDMDMDVDLSQQQEQQPYSTPPDDDQWPTFGSTTQQPRESIGLLSSSPGAVSIEPDSPVTPTSTFAPSCVPTSAFSSTYTQPQQPRSPRTRVTRTTSSTSPARPRKSTTTATTTTTGGPHPRTRKRNNHPSSSPSSEEDSASAIQKAKHAHSVIERRYRDNLNGKMMQLQRVILAAEADEASKMNSTDAAAASPSLLDDTKASPGGSSRVRKSDIMARAINYIHRSETQMRLMTLELSRLQDQVNVYQKLVKCEEHGGDVWDGVGVSRLRR